MRDINDILYFRTDISPFLVHLTRTRKGVLPRRSAKADFPFDDEDENESSDILAKDVLRAIIDEKQLIPGDTLISDARFGIKTYLLSNQEQRKYFGAISFTETPLAEVHSLLEISRRQINLEPYGLVFLKERLRERGVMPVWYLNNEQGDKDGVARALCSLIATNSEAAAQILPLISVFGRLLQGPGSKSPGTRVVDFSWEREWRWPTARGPFEFTEEDVFVGLCPHPQIPFFEQLFAPVRFIDPRRTMKWYATQLVQSRHRLSLKFSVV